MFVNMYNLTVYQYLLSFIIIKQKKETDNNGIIKVR